jgi:hypothetical protein
MLEITIDAKGLRRLVKNLTLLLAELESRDEIMRDIAKEQNARWALNFNSQGGEYGSWQSTSGYQQERRSREGYSATPTLLRSGDTMQHFINQNEQAVITDESVLWTFTNKTSPRASTVSHHLGYNLGSSRIPSRVLWKLDDEDTERAINKLDRWLNLLVTKYLI